jgi:5-methylthioadenosine/S-adenosylhomocysteine deaminase
MTLTALLNRCRCRDPTVFPAWEVLRIATIEGARAHLHVSVQAGDEVGSLKADKRAAASVIRDVRECAGMGINRDGPPFDSSSV